MEDIKYKKLLLLYITVSFRPILWPWSHNSYTKNFILKQQQIRINYKEEISIKSDAKMKDYQV